MIYFSLKWTQWINFIHSLIHSHLFRHKMYRSTTTMNEPRVKIVLLYCSVNFLTFIFFSTTFWSAPSEAWTEDHTDVLATPPTHSGDSPLICSLFFTFTTPVQPVNKRLPTVIQLKDESVKPPLSPGTTFMANMDQWNVRTSTKPLLHWRRLKWFKLDNWSEWIKKGKINWQTERNKREKKLICGVLIEWQH